MSAKFFTRFICCSFLPFGQFRQMSSFLLVITILSITTIQAAEDVDSSKTVTKTPVVSLNTDQNIQQIDDEISGKVFRIVLLPVREALLSSEINGKVIAINFRLGKSFKKGDELIKLDDVVYKASLEKALAAYDASKLSLAAAKDLRSRNDASLVDLANAQREFASAQAEKTFAERNFSACHLLAPFDGKVAGVYTRESELIEAGVPVIKVIDDSTLLGHIVLPGYLYSKIKDGMNVRLRSGSGGQKVSAVFTRIAPAINPSSGMFEAYLQIPNNNGVLKAGENSWLAVEELDAR